MKTFSWPLLSLLALLLACEAKTNQTDSQALDAPLDPFEQNEKLGRGINFGNALEAPNEGDWGFTIEEGYFNLVKAQGFNSIRVPIRWSAHALENEPYTIDESFFERVDWVIEKALEHDLLIIINMHHYEEIFAEPAQQRDRFLAMWEQISSRYADQPGELLFEILNEPHDQLSAELWNELLPMALNVIREENPFRTVVIGAAEWGGIPGLQKLQIPEDGNLIVTVHYYEPFNFTHQGAEWVQGQDMDQYLGTTWNASPEEIAEVRDHFQTIVNWGLERGVPINIGEFGAYGRAPQASRARWTAEIVRFALEKDMSFHYWEFGSGFGIFRPATNEWYTDLLQALVDTQPAD